MLDVLATLLDTAMWEGRVFFNGIPANDSSEKGVSGTEFYVARGSAEVPKTDISADRQKIGRIDPVGYVSVTLMDVLYRRMKGGGSK
jgi:hypothetical protein